MKLDVAIIGGGPAGSALGTLLRKYDPSLEVAIFEMERFPRDHVGESLLPVVPRILNEMGVWDKVEAADFPIKVGAKFRWGNAKDEGLVDLLFLPEGRLQPEPRPAKYVGQRTATAFQVDRSVFDKILLDHCRSCGCKVFEEAKVVHVVREQDRIEHLVVSKRGSSTGEEQIVEADYYVDASGGSGVVRSALDVSVESPTLLRNIAIWDYWQNAEWAERVGVGGTFIYVLSLGWGWLWFIPLSPTRTSLGVVTSAEYYKKSGESTEQLYQRAISEEPHIAALVAKGHRENSLRATKDWSFVADRMCGENWFLVGDAAGFADPILSAGMSLAVSGARRAAYSILEMRRGEAEPQWIRDEFEWVQKKNLRNHIRFADYWYAANAKFTDLKEYCSQIAEDSGITLDAESAFHWLGTGGFSDEITGVPFIGTFRLHPIQRLMGRFSGQRAPGEIARCNIFELDLEGAEEHEGATYRDGRVLKIPCLSRDGKVLPLHQFYGLVYKALQQEREIRPITERIALQVRREGVALTQDLRQFCMETLEAMIAEGWVKAFYDPAVPMLRDVAS